MLPMTFEDNAMMAIIQRSYSGIKAQICEENPLVSYKICYAHILNSCLVDLSTQGAMSRTHGSLPPCTLLWILYQKVI